jgi:hypothetical protein
MAGSLTSCKFSSSSGSIRRRPSHQGRESHITASSRGVQKKSIGANAASIGLVAPMDRLRPSGAPDSTQLTIASRKPAETHICFGSHNLTLLPSGSRNQPNLPYSQSIGRNRVRFERHARPLADVETQPVGVPLIELLRVGRFEKYAAHAQCFCHDSPSYRSVPGVQRLPH